MFQIRRRINRIAERLALYESSLHVDARALQAGSGRVIFVCSGNICRSPYAEIVARSRGLKAISCGTDTRNDLPADPTAIEEAARRGSDLTKHRTTRWQDLQLQAGDTIVVAQLKHARAIRRRAQQEGCRVVLMSSLLLPEFDVVWDPHGKPVETYRRSFDLIERAIGRLAALGAHKA